MPVPPELPREARDCSRKWPRRGWTLAASAFPAGSRVEELSIRELADRHHVHRPDGAAGGGVGVAPGAEDSGAGVPPVGGTQTGHRRLVERGLDAPRKQRHTARRVLARLVDEQAAVDVLLGRTGATREPRESGAGERFISFGNEAAVKRPADHAASVAAWRWSARPSPRRGYRPRIAAPSIVS